MREFKLFYSIEKDTKKYEEVLTGEAFSIHRRNYNKETKNIKIAHNFIIINWIYAYLIMSCLFVDQNKEKIKTLFLYNAILRSILSVLLVNFFYAMLLPFLSSSLLLRLSSPIMSPDPISFLASSPN